MLILSVVANLSMDNVKYMVSEIAGYNLLLTNNRLYVIMTLK